MLLLAFHAPELHHPSLDDEMTDPRNAAVANDPRPGLVRQLGLFDATMVVMGGIVGSGIFINPYVVARQVHTPALILGAWVFGGIIGLGGAFIWADSGTAVTRWRATNSGRGRDRRGAAACSWNSR